MTRITPRTRKPLKLNPYLLALLRGEYDVKPTEQKSSRPTHAEQNPAYRKAMQDAGRGRLL